MSLVRCKDKRTGITYVYESESYWDKEKQQPRARRKLIGKLDETTGEIIPTGGRGRKKKDPMENKSDNGPAVSPDASRIDELETRIQELLLENEQLKEERRVISRKLKVLMDMLNEA
ncbi:MAG: hypothetical protein Q4B59_05450 [Lachnospiraceae bacterium]|nr:hypothetical protein [Lachnospiraceae bacterium]